MTRKLTSYGDDEAWTDVAKYSGPVEHRLAAEEKAGRERRQRELLVRAAGWYRVGPDRWAYPGVERGVTLAEAYALTPVEEPDF